MLLLIVVEVILIVIVNFRRIKHIFAPLAFFLIVTLII